MAAHALNSEQQAFLEECLLEFSDRYTDADLEYKKIYDLGIPTPPIMCPWSNSNRRFNNRDRAGGSRYYDRHYHRGDDYRYENNHRDRQQRNSGYHEGRSERSFRPY